MKYIVIAFIVFIITSCASREFNKNIESYFVPERIIMKDSIKLDESNYAFWLQYDLDVNGIFGHSKDFISITTSRYNINKSNWVINSDWINRLEFVDPDTVVIELKDEDDYYQYKSKIDKFNIHITYYKNK